MSTPRSGYRPIGTNTGFLFAAQAVGSILRALYAVVLARWLGPELFGLMNYGLGWYAAFLAVANLQLESYMSRQVALYPARTSEVLSQAATLRIFSTGFVFVVAVTAAFTHGADSALVPVLLVYSFALAGRSAAMWCSSAFISREDAWQVFKMEVVFRVVEVLAGIAALLLGSGLFGVALIHALSWWGQSIYGLWLVRGHHPAICLRVRLVEQVALFRAVLPVAIASIGATWLMQGPFVLFRDKASVAAELGVLALVLQIFVLLAGVPVALGRAALPALSRTVARTDSKDALFLGLVLRAAIPGTAVLIIGAAAAGPWVIPLIFGDAYHSAGQHLALGMMLVLPFGVATIANQILIAHGRTWPAMICALCGAAAMTILVHIFVPPGGAVTDYLLCIFAGMSVWLIVALAQVSRAVAVDWNQCLLKPALAGGLGVGLYYALDSAVNAWIGFVVAIPMLIAAQWVFNIVDQRERIALWRFILAGRGRDPSNGQSRKQD